MATRSLRLDPHVHSVASYDGHETVDDILAHAAAIGLDAVAITDHDIMSASLRAVDRAPAYGLVAVPGVELSTGHGHLLGLGIESMPTPGLSYRASVAAIRERGGVAVVPHPFQRWRHGVRPRHLVDCDAIEVYNAWLLTGVRNRRARQFADRHGYPGVAGSDAHRLATVGRAYTEIQVAPDDVHDPDALIAAIQRGETAVRGRRAPLRQSLGHMLRAGTRKTVGRVTRLLPTWS